jgi:hypothetical protein
MTISARFRPIRSDQTPKTRPPTGPKKKRDSQEAVGGEKLRSRIALREKLCADRAGEKAEDDEVEPLERIADGRRPNNASSHGGIDRDRRHINPRRRTIRANKTPPQGVPRCCSTNVEDQTICVKCDKLQGFIKQ